MTPAKSPMPASTKQKTAAITPPDTANEQADDTEEHGHPEGGDRASPRRAEDERQACRNLGAAVHDPG